METAIVIILVFILAVLIYKARVDAREHRKSMKEQKTKAVIAKATALAQDTKSAPPVKKTQKAPVKKVTKKAVAKKPAAKKTTPNKKK
jgi:predicted Holliday junction resolvase-like endonuclease